MSLKRILTLGFLGSKSDKDGKAAEIVDGVIERNKKTFEELAKH